MDIKIKTILKPRSGIQDTRLEARDTKKNSRPRTALPRTDPLEAMNRNARGQIQEIRTQAKVFSKKKGLQKNFLGNPKKVFKILFQANSNKKRSPKKFF